MSDRQHLLTILDSYYNPGEAEYRARATPQLARRGFIQAIGAASAVGAVGAVSPLLPQPAEAASLGQLLQLALPFVPQWSPIISTALTIVQSLTASKSATPAPAVASILGSSAQIASAVPVTAAGAKALQPLTSKASDAVVLGNALQTVQQLPGVPQAAQLGLTTIRDILAKSVTATAALESGQLTRTYYTSVLLHPWFIKDNKFLTDDATARTPRGVIVYAMRRDSPLFRYMWEKSDESVPVQKYDASLLVPSIVALITKALGAYASQRNSGLSMTQELSSFIDAVGELAPLLPIGTASVAPVSAAATPPTQRLLDIIAKLDLNTSTLAPDTKVHLTEARSLVLGAATSLRMVELGYFGRIFHTSMPLRPLVAATPVPGKVNGAGFSQGWQLANAAPVSTPVQVYALRQGVAKPVFGLPD